MHRETQACSFVHGDATSCRTMPGVITKLSRAIAAVRTPTCMSWTDERRDHIPYAGQSLARHCPVRSKTHLNQALQCRKVLLRTSWACYVPDSNCTVHVALYPFLSLDCATLYDIKNAKVHYLKALSASRWCAWSTVISHFHLCKSS